MAALLQAEMDLQSTAVQTSTPALGISAVPSFKHTIPAAPSSVAAPIETARTSSTTYLAVKIPKAAQPNAPCDVEEAKDGKV